MSDLFTANWMSKFKDEWNNESELSDALGEIGFESIIGYGFKGDDTATGYIKVENGKVVDSGSYTDQDLNWDMRCTSEQWQKLMNKEVGMTGLGLAFTTGKLKFTKGDYASMSKDPRMATPFVKSFSVMGRV